MYILYQIISFFVIIKAEELKFVFQVHRHGARSPFKGVHKGVDCYGEKWIAKNELTEVGKRSHFLIGVRNRRRFIEKYKLLKKKFDKEEIEIYTTDYNRTIQSVYAQLQGLYPEKTGKRIPNHLINTSLIIPPTENYTKFYKDMELKYFSGKKSNYSLPNRINVFPFHFFHLPDHHIQLQSRTNCPNLKKNRSNVEKRDDIIFFINRLSEKYGDAVLYYDDVKTLQYNLEEAKLVLDVWKNKGNSFSGEVETYNQKLHDMKYRYAMAEMERVANAYNDYISNINIGEEGYNQYIESYPKDRILFEKKIKNTYYPGTSLNVYSTLPYAYNRNIIW